MLIVELRWTARTPAWRSASTWSFISAVSSESVDAVARRTVAAFAHIGNGTNMIYVDPEHDLVAVVRWIDNSAKDGFVQRLLAALTPQEATTAR